MSEKEKFRSVSYPSDRSEGTNTDPNSSRWIVPPSWPAYGFTSDYDHFGCVHARFNERGRYILTVSLMWRCSACGYEKPAKIIDRTPLSDRYASLRNENKFTSI